jgi:hypothetical protein
MMRRAPKWTHSYTDRHGKVRFYLRRPGHKKVPLPGLPWSPQFMAAREAALAGDEWKREAILCRPGKDNPANPTRDP